MAKLWNAFEGAKNKNPRSQQKEVAQIGKAVIKNVVFAFEDPKEQSIEQ